MCIKDRSEANKEGEVREALLAEEVVAEALEGVNEELHEVRALHQRRRIRDAQRQHSRKERRKYALGFTNEICAETGILSRLWRRQL